MAQIRINQARKVQIAHQFTGPYIRKTSLLIADGARLLAPRGTHESGSGKRKPGLQLQRSIRIERSSSMTNIVDRVGSDKQYAASVHQGSSPHFINARGKMLKFQWERGTLLMQARGRRRGGTRRLRPRGNYFYFLRVRHPGNKRPVRFLTTPMHLYGRLRGFRTTSTPASRSRLP